MIRPPNAASAYIQQQIVDYFLEGCKPREEFRIGMEVEHLCVRLSDGARLPYFGDEESVLAVLQHLLENRGGVPVGQDGHTIGIHADWGDVTLEPGGQIEWASPPCRRLSSLIEQLNTWLAVFDEVSHAHGAARLNTAFDRVHETASIPWVPKRRYDIMRAEYLGEQTADEGEQTGDRELAAAAMGRTAGVHVSVDYSDARDWQRKFRACLMLAPVTVGLFANSSSGGGMSHDFAAVRPALWLELDPARCRPPPAAFRRDFSIADWAAWVSEVPQLIALEHGRLAPGSGRPFVDSGLTPAAAREPWELHLSSIFAPVRTGHHLEVRTVDMQDVELLPAAPAFWYGLLYCDDSLSRVLDLVDGITDQSQWEELFFGACRHGLRANPQLAWLAKRTLQLAIDGLQHNAEQHATGLRSLNLLAQKNRGTLT